MCQIKYHTQFNNGTDAWNAGLMVFFKGAEQGLTQEQFNQVLTPRICDYAEVAIYLLTSEDCGAGSEVAKAVYA